MEEKTARNWYLWLWLSPVITVTTFGLFYDTIPQPAWNVRESYRTITRVYETLAVLGSSLWHLILLIPALNKKSAFVRWHGRQALILAGVRTVVPLGFVAAFGFDFGPELVAVPILIVVWFFGTLLSYAEAGNGKCTLMRWRGLADAQPAVVRALESAQGATADAETPVGAAREGTAPTMVCPSCGEAYDRQDLQEEDRLAFLLQETAGWDVPERLRAPYAERLAGVRARLGRRVPVLATAQSAAEAPAAAPAITVPAPEPAEAEPPAPPKEKVPFDQWLLSERNIKIALYTGGLLLVLAGAIFIGVRWATIPGPVKFFITLLVTGLTYLGGYLLYQRQALRLGGIALLGIASGFLTLNFAVLQIYVVGPGGLRNDVMWLIASPVCLLLYLLTATWARSDLFVYMSLAAAGSTLAALLVVLDAPLFAFVLAASLLFLVVLALAKALQQTPWADFGHLPCLIVSHAGMPLAIVAAVVGWVSKTQWFKLPEGSPWLALSALGVGVLFYVLANVLYRWLAVRWVAALLLPVTLALVLTELRVSATATGITLMGLALIYVGLGYVLERREERRSGAWPLYATAYLLALYVTALSIPKTEDLILALIGDVALLAVSSAILRSYWFIYGAVWLFALPVYLILQLYVPALHNRGLLMGLLGLNYAVAGFVLSRHEATSRPGVASRQGASKGALPRRGGPFLTAAVALSVFVVGLAWGNSVVVTLLLAVVAALYLAGALWLGWPALLLPAVVAVGVGILTGQKIWLGYRVGDLGVSQWQASRELYYARLKTARAWLEIAYAALAGFLLLGGLGLRRRGEARWAWPLTLSGAVVLLGAYLVGLVDGWANEMHWLAIGLSAAFAAIALAFAWLERDALGKRELAPVLTYLGLGAILSGHFYAISLVAGRRAGDVWPIYTAGLCALYVALAWLLRREPTAGIYATPLRRAGLFLTAVPMVGALIVFEPTPGAVTFGIAGAIYLADAILRRSPLLIYLSIGAFVVTLWGVLRGFKVSELQAYLLPLGLALLSVGGWNKRKRKGGATYWLPTLLGLGVLMVSAFVQSLPRRAYAYAILLGVESLLALGWGIRARSRIYVLAGALALVANAIAQFGLAFAEWPRWIQIGVTGAVLLGGGLAALFKREELLQTRKRLAEELKSWER